MPGHKWIREAISKPGVLRRYAKRQGVIEGDEPLPREWLEEMAKRSDRPTGAARSDDEED